MKPSVFVTRTHPNHPSQNSAGPVPLRTNVRTYRRAVQPLAWRHARARTTTLNQAAIVHFVTQLARVSKEEPQLPAR